MVEKIGIMKNKIKKYAIETVYDIAGSILFSVGIYIFASGAGFAPGGVSGLAIILNHLFRVPIGTATLLLNIPIILISYKVIGRKFLLRSFRTMLISIIFLDVIFPLFPIYQGNHLLASVFAGVFTGAGLAIIYMRGSSTGGVDFLTLSVKKLRPHFSIGQITLALDSIVILLGGLFFKNIDAILYGIISTYASTAVIDKILYGAGSGKLAIIISNKGSEVAEAISRKTERGSTLIRATGTFSGQERHVILCACSNSEIIKVRNAAHSIDQKAFVMITEASEVFGEGFQFPQV